MEKDIATILAVNPGSRYVGLAVFKDGDLRDWRVSSLGRGALESRKRNVAKLLSTISERHGIAALVVKKLHPARSSGSLDELVQTVKRVARNQRLKLIELSLDTVKNLLIPVGRRNKRRLMEIAASRYPFLLRQVKPPVRGKYAHVVRMFEAVALGLAYLTRIETKK